jgi:hypothetical protein
MKNSTYSRRSKMLSTVKKSQATIPAACWCRNARQVLFARRGAGRAGGGAAWCGSRLLRRAHQAVAARLGCAGSPSAGSPWPGGQSAAAPPGPAVPAGRAVVWEGPRAGNQPPVPAQQRLRSNEEARPARPWQQAADRGEQRPIGGLQLGTWGLAAEDHELVRRTRISKSLAASPRASSTSNWMERYNMR